MKHHSMKSTIRYTLLLAGAAGLFSFANQLVAANSAGAGCAMGACCGAPAAETIADSKAKPDLLATCPVSGEKLGEMGASLSPLFTRIRKLICAVRCARKISIKTRPNTWPKSAKPTRKPTKIDGQKPRNVWLALPRFGGATARART